MTGVVRKLKINKRYASSACPWCGDMLALGEEGAVCEACEAPHHTRCWDKENGCGQSDCINAPLRQDLEVRDLESEPAANEMHCPHCRKLLRVGTIKCSGCLRFTTASGLFEGAQKTAEEASEAFMLGIASVVVPPLLNLSFVFFGGNYKSSSWSWIPLLIAIRCGWSAMKKGGQAKGEIAVNQTLKGRGLAIAAQILGGIGVALPVLGLLMFVLLLFAGG